LAKLGFKVDITGRVAIEKKLGNLTAKLSTDGAEEAVLAGAKKFAEGMEARTPRATGAAADSVTFGIVDTEPGRVVAAAGPHKKYWAIRFKEYGFTDPAGVKHEPQAYGGPFARTTYDEDKDEAIKAAGDAMSKHVK
jgi:HK97 gp10 family phage protein